MLPVEDAQTLPLLYHLNSEPWLNIEAYEDPSNEARFRPLANDLTRIALPAPAAGTELFALLKKRGSCRSFDRRELSLSLVSEVLAGAYGISRLSSLPDGRTVCARPLPSAGGLYPLEIYLAAQNVAGLAEGLYRYSPLHHCLETIRAEPVMRPVTSLLLEQHFVENANAVFFITADFPRTLKKYGPRGYRYLLLEAGHCVQNICLLAAENDLGSLCVGGFLDTEMNRFLGLEKTGFTLYCAALGHYASI